MKCITLLVSAAALASTAAFAAERAIVVPPMLQMSWEFVTPGTTARLRPHLGVGFWQRGSGAAPGVGANYVSALEYQLPEAAPSRVRSASFQFSGRPSQCVGAEPVVIDVYAYAADGRPEVGDTQKGSRVAQLSATCSDRQAFARPIDVTAIVRQLSVPAGVRHVGFNIRKANHRQGPGLFELSPGRLTVVLADEASFAQAPRSRVAEAAMPRFAPRAEAGTPRFSPGAEQGMPRSSPAAVAAPGSARGMTGEHVDPAFRGEWVPAQTACTSPLKLVLDAHLVAFVNGSQRAEFRRLDQCFSCMGRDVQDVTLLSTDAMGDSPFMITLDGSRKARPAVSVDFPNDRSLAARFPFGNRALKKCS